MTCEKYLNDEYTAVIANLDQLYQDVSHQISDLERALQQIDKYQHDIQMLKQKLIQEEQLLKTMTPDQPDAADSVQVGASLFIEPNTIHQLTIYLNNHRLLK